MKISRAEKNRSRTDRAGVLGRVGLSGARSGSVIGVGIGIVAATAGLIAWTVARRD